LFLIGVAIFKGMIRIGFSTPRRKSLISSFICWATKSRVSHVFFVYWDKDWDADFVLDVIETGFRIIPLAKYETINRIVEIVEPQVPIDIGVKEIALNYLGTPYSFKGLLGVGIVQLGRWLKRKWSNPLHTSETLFCSQCAVLALQSSGYPKSSGLVPEDCTPQDVLDFLKD